MCVCVCILSFGRDLCCVHVWFICVYECVPVCAFCTITQHVLIFYTVPGVRAHLEGALCRGRKHNLMTFHLLLVSFSSPVQCIVALI